MSRLRGAVDRPLVFDSTELPVLETALELYGGKAVLNSINFEDGEEPPTKRMELARKFGAGVIALTIDETGMAKDVRRKLEVARRLVDFACTRHGLPRSDLLIDPLTFTICTGNEDDRGLGIATLDAHRARSAPSFPTSRSFSDFRTSPSASTRLPATCSTRCSSTRRSSAA